MGGVNGSIRENEMFSEEAETVWRVTKDGGVAFCE